MLERTRRILLAGLAAGLLCTGPGLSARAQTDPPPLRIGIIGAGKIGGTLGELWAAAGHEILLSSRHPERLRALAERLGPRVRAGYPREAAAFGEVILISVPYGALPQVGRDYATELRGKIVLETGNPFAGRDGAMAHAARERGVGLASAAFLGGVRLVRAFNSIPHFSLRDEAHRAGEKVAVPLASDDPQAMAMAERLVREAGFEPLAVGGLAASAGFDVGSAVFGRALTAVELRRALGMD